MAYATRAELLALDGMDDSAVTDDIADDALAQAEELIDSYCGTSFTYKAFTKVLDGNDRMSIDLEVLFPRTITSVDVVGYTTISDTSDWGLYDEGILVRPTGVFASRIAGRNVTVVGTAGATETVPAEIKHACLQIARQIVLDQVSRIPDGATSLTNEFGNISLAQPGGPRKPTGLPTVNATLNRYRHRPPGAF